GSSESPLRSPSCRRSPRLCRFLSCCSRSRWASSLRSCSSCSRAWSKIIHSRLRFARSRLRLLR
ncbi:Uncharacterized protein APZ42_029673, partial [Daphnia magna]